jgi:hypothetical protein
MDTNPVQQDTGSDQQSGVETAIQQAPQPVSQQAPATAPASDAASLQSELAPYAAQQRDALQKASDSQNTPTTTPVGKHDGLFRIIQAIGIGLSSAGHAMGSGGKEGGAPEVIAAQNAIQQQKIAAQNASIAQRNVTTQQQLMAANIAEKQMQNVMLMHSVPHDMTMQDLQEKSAQQNLADTKTAADAKAQDLFDNRNFTSPGYDVDPSTGQVRRIGQGQATGQPTGQTPTTGTSNIPVPRDGQFFLRQQSVFDAGVKEITAANGGKPTPLLDAAQKIMADPNSTLSQINGAVLGVQRQANLSDATVKKLKDIAESSGAQTKNDRMRQSNYMVDREVSCRARTML